MRVVGIPINFTDVPKELNMLVSENEHVMDFAVKITYNSEEAYALHVVPYDSPHCAVIIFQFYQGTWQGFDPSHPKVSPLLYSLSDFIHTCLLQPPALRERNEFVYVEA